MRQRGFTLVELMVVIAITGILLSIATLNWNEMQRKSAIESQIKTMHADLMEVRLQALYGKRARSVVISGQVYKSYSSTVITPTPLETKQLSYPVVTNTNGSTLTFDKCGLVFNGYSAVCVGPVNNTAAVDSLVINVSKNNLGKRDGGGCGTSVITQK